MNELFRKKALWTAFKACRLPEKQENRLLLKVHDDLEELLVLLRCEDACLNLLEARQRRALERCLDEGWIAAIWERLDHLGIDVILAEEADFPPALLAVKPRPRLLYLRGDRTLLRVPNRLAIVGTRHASAYGEKQTREFALELARKGLCIVSGLARGIDGVAHRAALEEGKTIAVLAGGLDRPYPPEHAELFKAIAKEGLLVSEYPPGHLVQPYNLPKRNRLIAGLSSALFIPQANIKSGTRHTLDAALDLGIDVYALPGRVDEDMSALPNKMIQEGAKIALCPVDILESFVNLEGHALAMRSETALVQRAVKISLEDLSEEETALFKLLQVEDCNVEELLAGLNIALPQLLVSLTKLEQKNMIQKDASGNRFMVKRCS